VLRRAPSAQLELTKSEKKKVQPQFALTAAVADQGREAHKEEKKKKDKVQMNEQNWQLA